MIQSYPSKAHLTVTHSQSAKVACVTGGAKRIGKAIVQALHTNGYHVVIHYHTSEQEAIDLAHQLNQRRPNSAQCIQGNLEVIENLDKLAEDVVACFGRLDLLVHNASRFYPTPMGYIECKDWDALFRSNTQAPLFLTQALAPALQATFGNVISLLDIHADNRPFKDYPVYNMAKAAHRMMVQSLALELAPNIRVNGVAPGVNILPEMDSEQALAQQQIARICQGIPLGRMGTPEDIAQAVIFLATAPYITGQIIAVDGGRSLTLAGY